MGVPEKPITEFEKRYQCIVIDARIIADNKYHDYGPDNISALGEKGVFVRIHDKVSRLKRLVWEDRETHAADESVEDTYLDLLNYAIYGLLLHRGQWK